MVSFVPSLFGSKSTETDAWQESVELTRARFDALLRSVPTYDTEKDRIMESLAYGATFFAAVAKRTPVTPNEYTRRPGKNPYLLNNPYFWGGSYYSPNQNRVSVSVINIGNFNRTSWNTIEKQKASSSCSLCCKSDENETEEQKKSRQQGYVALAIAGIALASLGTLLVTLYFWAIPSLKEADNARSNAFTAFEMSEPLHKLHNMTNRDEHGICPREIFLIGRELNSVSTAERESKIWNTVGWFAMTWLTTGTVHAVISAIALVAISDMLTATASAAVLDFAAFCAISCSPPILCALVIIGLIGIYAFYRSGQSADIANSAAEDGLRAYSRLNDKLFKNANTLFQSVTRVPLQPTPQPSAPPANQDPDAPSPYEP